MPDRVAASARVGVLGRPASSNERAVEWALVAAFGVLRAGVVLQMAVSGVGFWLRSEMPLGSGIMIAVATVWAACLFVNVVRRGSFIAVSFWWGVVDVVVTAAVLVVIGCVLPHEWLIGTWHAWQYAWLCVVTPTIAAWLQSRWCAIAVAVGLGGIYAVTVWPGNSELLMTIVINAVSCVIFGVVGAVLCPAARRLGRVADENRHQAVRLATKVEQERNRFHIHNVTGLLDYLTRDDIPADMLPSVREQARQEVNRLRGDILAAPDGDEASDSQPDESLEQVVLASTAGFGHLPLQVRATLGRDVLLDQDEVLVVQTALVTLLYNVQLHAKASEVVVHADCVDKTWEVSVCDDGVGFDPENTAYGFGLRRQVLDAAQSKGMTVEINSKTGEGTCVYIRGRQHDL